MRNHRDDIKNEIAYFYTVIKNMDTKDEIKQSKINEHELQIDDILYDNFWEDFDVDKQVAEQSLLGWIELIENKDLHKAIKNLSLEEQILLSYIFYKDKTQSEIANLYKVTQQSISYKTDKIISKIKKYIFKK